MIISTRESTTVGDLSDAFAGAYPYLHIDFYLHPHGVGEGSPLSQKLDSDCKLTDIRTRSGAAMMEIHDWYRTGDLEQDFSNIFGLYIQVSRIEAGVKVQTTQSDMRTIAEQNQAAANLAQELMDGTNQLLNAENPS
jgi:hypothetical protein